jgi:signal transduction histidine kinase
MKIILSFIKTFRFRLTLWFVTFLILMVFALITGLNLTLSRYRSTLPEPDFQTSSDLQSWNQKFNDVKSTIFRDFRNYSFIGMGIVIVVGAAVVYFFSGRMLQPVTKVSKLAKRISYSNLKERLNYSGPEDEIKRLADTFDKMLARLEGAVESQKYFIQDASHELRTPIATALTNIEVLEMNSQATVKDYQELSQILKLSLERLNNISNSLLLLSSDNNAIVVQLKIDLSVVIDEIVKESTSEAKRQGVSIIWNSQAFHPVVLGDEYRIKQAIFNLIDNAIKYNRPGGSVEITIQTHEQSIVIKITDTGIGIGPEDLPQIFDRFYRIDKSRSRQRGGSGLGLAIVKKIIEEHAGKISVESILGKGSTFGVILPLDILGSRNTHSNLS